jgi:hypothetical protein
VKSSGSSAFFAPAFNTACITILSPGFIENDVALLPVCGVTEPFNIIVDFATPFINML